MIAWSVLQPGLIIPVLDITFNWGITMLPQPARLLGRVTWLDLMFTVTRLRRALVMRTCGVTLMRTSSPHKSRKVSPDL